MRKSISKRHALKKLPSPPGAHWLYGHDRQGPFDPGYKWLIDTVTAFPRIYTLWLGPTPLPMLVHPETIKPLLMGTVSNKKSEFYELFFDWVGEGLGTAEGAKWKRNRRLLTRSFNLDILRTYTPVSNDCVEVLLEKMNQAAVEGQQFEMYSGLVLCTYDVILRTACSYKSSCQIRQIDQENGFNVLSACEALLQFIQLRQYSNRLLLIPWIFRLSANYSEYRNAFQYLRKFAGKLVEERKKELSEKADAGDPITKPRDFLDTLVMARDEEGSGLTVKEMVDEVNTFLFAGHETTATSMTWFLYFLSKHPEHQTKIREEVEEILAGRDSERITVKDLSRLEYMTMAIKESLRMMPAGPLISRTLTAPYTVDGVTIPQGTMVGICLHQLHHNPTVWGDDHMEYKPSRFLPENVAKMDPFSYSPFSAGSRNCIGQQFALNEMKVFTARILKRFRLKWVEGEPDLMPSMTFVSKPMKPLYINLEAMPKAS
ncbi:phylloquinone omega-hydroxylase CYP4F11-like isoform X2 [Acanthaster planci]|uniref:Phylloquinone omega-hydroxylase CYP4F11-like isoform X2 n=1 Tax=Acanthaster planci TaxID=133434 RepID=A0A8B7ZC29_ACAPL|nr:phylloquinone omega-hydroxylase CYP4F11-like isoform X2 [Acanthaster planci]